MDSIYAQSVNNTSEKVGNQAKLPSGYLILYRADGGFLGDYTYFKLFCCTKEELPQQFLEDSESCKAFGIDQTASDALNKIRTRLADNHYVDVVPLSLILHGVTHETITEYKTNEEALYKNLRKLLDPADRVGCIED